MLILVRHPPEGPDGLIPSVDYQKVSDFESSWRYMFTQSRF
jgi:hypothetical protein